VSGRLGRSGWIFLPGDDYVSTPYAGRLSTDVAWLEFLSTLGLVRLAVAGTAWWWFCFVRPVGTAHWYVGGVASGVHTSIRARSSGVRPTDTHKPTITAACEV
jgi:hypothetical protein